MDPRGVCALASARHRGVCAPSRRLCSVATSVLRRGVRSPSRRLCSVAASCPSISTNRFERARHARHQERRRPLRREPRCSRSGRVGGRVLVAQCRVSQPLKDTDDGFVDLSSRTRAIRYPFRSSSFMKCQKSKKRAPGRRLEVIITDQHLKVQQARYLELAISEPQMCIRKSDQHNELHCQVGGQGSQGWQQTNTF